MSTVERTATPTRSPPVARVEERWRPGPWTGEILAKDAAWLGTKIWATIKPNRNMRPRMNHRLVVRLIWVRTSMQAASPSRPR
jgi:hypothetical protein